MPPRSRCVLAAVSAVSGIALAGCASSSPSSAGSPSASASSPAAAGTTAGAAAPSASPAGSVTPGGPMATATGQAAECTSAQLKVAYTNNAQIRNGALNGMSHADSVIMFTNVSSHTCWTKGYPGVTALNAAGHEIKNAVRGQAANGRIPLITLGPGQVASAEITGNTASCTKITKISRFLITVPDQRLPAQLPGTEMCLNTLGIGPLQPGNAAGLSL